MNRVYIPFGPLILIFCMCYLISQSLQPFKYLLFYLCLSENSSKS